MCNLLGYSKQAYYKRLNYVSKHAYDDYLIVELVKKKRETWKKGSGRNLLKSLESDFLKHNIKIGRDKFFKILADNNLQIKRKSKRAITTMSYHHFHKYPNLIKGICFLTKRHQVLVSDITYIWLTREERFCYLFLITDLYSRKIIGYCVSDSLSRVGALKSLKMALTGFTSKEMKTCTHHSDRGVQYCCHEYTNLLKRNGLSISMTENSDPRENSVAERINKTIKEEFTLEKTQTFANLKTAKMQMKKIISFYNEDRPHSSVERMTPSEAHKSQGKLKRLWKSYYKKQVFDYECVY